MKAQGILFCVLCLCISVIQAAILRLGNPVSFTDSKPHLVQVRMSGVDQFVNHYQRAQRVQMPRFLWGDEVEYGVFGRAEVESDSDSDEDDEDDEDEAEEGSDKEKSVTKHADTTADDKDSGHSNASSIPIDRNAQSKSVYDLSLRGAEIREYLSVLEEHIAHDQALHAPSAASDSTNADHKSSAHTSTSPSIDVAKDGALACLWTPEYGAWMVEAVPAAPYDGYAADLLLTEKSMKLRRQRLHMALREGEVAPSMSNFPMLGVTGYPHSKRIGTQRDPITNSAYVSDRVINPHPRFGALTRNIRLRRGSNVCVIAQRETLASANNNATENEVTHTKNENEFVPPPQRPSSSAENAQCPPYSRDTEVHMDAMAFGMGCCCLQVTMQSRNERESRFMHDQLAPLTPLFLALTAATPIFKGCLVDTDTRWEYIGMSVDCRTDAERSVPNANTTYDACLAAGGVKPIANSRYSGISRYIAVPETPDVLQALEKLNDLNDVLDEDVLTLLQGRGIDTILAKHLAHLFARDPLVIFDDAIELDNTRVLDHFDNVQSTNWRTLRWKSPAVAVGLEAQRRQSMIDEKRRFNSQQDNMTTSASSSVETSHSVFTSAAAASDDASQANAISEDETWFQRDLGNYGAGWRVEFRPMELSLTDFENAAHSITVVLLTRAILALGYNFYMPMSVVEENMRRSKAKDAILTQKFFIRKFALQPDQGLERNIIVPDNLDLLELTIDEIFNGQKHVHNGFPGLYHAMNTYLDFIQCEEHVLTRLRGYLDLLSKRASGELPTTARWIRNYVTSHPAYTGDGTINSVINDDLVKVCDDIGMGVIQKPDLYGQRCVECLACISEDDALPFMEHNGATIRSLKEKCAQRVKQTCIHTTLTTATEPAADKANGKKGAYLKT